MNFFAHALVALERRAEPAWLAGAMAPDVAHMAGLRIARVEPGLFGEGVAFHPLTDEAFHGAPIFLSLMKEARVDLQRRGLALGPSLGIGHVGVELLLDGHLAREGVPEAYRDALSEAGGLGAAIEFRGQDQSALRARWREVTARLQVAPVPERYAEPAFVAARLIGILARRPRLAVASGNEPHVEAWAETWAERVERQAAQLMGQVESRLSR